MQPNSYQKGVLDDIRSFFVFWHACADPALAFSEHWKQKGAARVPAYSAPLHAAPQVCAKVPTAGGKTLIGIYALQEIFNVLGKRRGDPRLCVWLVPSLAIKDQVLSRFNTPDDGYRQALRGALDSQVSVISKNQLLAGGGQFNADLVRDEVVIAVLVYDSLRAEKKEDKKLYQQNGGVASFAADVASSESSTDTDQESVMAALASLQPVVIVDESHNATSELSRDMLARLNPSCVLELTATPREGANIISYVDAMALRDAHMVKLPVVVRNLPDRSSVIAHAVDLRTRLEAEAVAETAEGGAYIRPIVLFQAEPKNRTDSVDYEKIRNELVVQYGIDPEWVKIKTAKVNELKGVDLMANDCPVRFIITINALKEGWDCPFAYVLATLADRSSAVDVEQVLGRILRQPYIRPHGHAPLNMSYVLTASAVFSTTLERIIAGLNRAGFSRNDYRTPDLLADDTVPPTTHPGDQNALQQPTTPLQLPLKEAARPAHDNAEVGEVDETSQADSAPDYSVDSTLRCGAVANENLERAAAQLHGQYVSPEEREMKNSFPIRSDFASEISELRLPRFFRKVDPGNLFSDTEGGVLLDRDMLLENFRLADCDINDFRPNLTSGDLVQVDLKALTKYGLADYEPTRVVLKAHEMRAHREYLATLSPESKRQQLAGYISGWVGKMPPLGDSDLRAYINKLLGKMSAADMENVLEQQNAFVEEVKKRVRLEMARYRRKAFAHWVRTGEVFTTEHYGFDAEVHPVELYPPTANTLYEREERANTTTLEGKMADWLAEAENVRWWHRNHQTSGFYLNGPINHRPDFIVRTRNDTVVMIETKGEHLKNDESDTKIEIGKYWQDCVGRSYRYVMVFEQNPVNGAVSWQDAVEMLAKV